MDELPSQEVRSLAVTMLQDVQMMQTIGEYDLRKMLLAFAAGSELQPLQGICNVEIQCNTRRCHASHPLTWFGPWKKYAKLLIQGLNEYLMSCLIAMNTSCHSKEMLGHCKLLQAYLASQISSMCTKAFWLSDGSSKGGIEIDS